MSHARGVSAFGLIGFAIVALTLLTVGTGRVAAQGMFLKVDGINGESKEAKHVDWIDVQSFSVGVTQTGAAGKTGAQSAGRPALSDLSVTKLVDAASPALFLNACNGKHVKSVILEVAPPGGGKQSQVFLRYTLSDVLVTGVQTSGAGGGGDGRPQEQVTFAYGKIQMEYIPTDPKGGQGKPIQGGWDVTTNKQVSAPADPSVEPSHAASGDQTAGEQAAATPAPATARVPIDRRAIERVRVRQP